MIKSSIRLFASSGRLTHLNKKLSLSPTTTLIFKKPLIKNYAAVSSIKKDHATVSALKKDHEITESSNSRTYHWVSPEAEDLIAKAYARHQALADKKQSYPPSISVADLEKLDKNFHFEPVDIVDKMAFRTMKIFTHAFFNKRYNHHAVVLETVAAVPGIVASAARHMRSLRNMQRDNGWINPLQEESENERMHLLIWMQVTKPTKLERVLVIIAQGLYLNAYVLFYCLSPRAAHRFVGYLEEEAFEAYTDYLKAIDDGSIPNVPAPEIAKKYYRLPENATLRDCVLHVRADECMHRDFNRIIS
ncbi:hypothetical protein HK099_003676 [Clydaea vesicula]|uniref:Alternative oxidase n=1 Tax=Clydaea vesicula TaxID=447962 RepID=A0AAD5Y051_9FUNG|nr:hypothetical protein HK099_003676 [Clydaea vesicula]KAJ3395973.1 hypothetical protein HDU92_004470 [Lobulomyces angularis]